MKTIIIGVMISASTFWYNMPRYALENNLRIENLVNNLEAMEKAIQKMGPYYQYRIEPDGTLMVQLNGKWLVLRYENHR